MIGPDLKHKIALSCVNNPISYYDEQITVQYVASGGGWFSGREALLDLVQTCSGHYSDLDSAIQLGEWIGTAQAQFNADPSSDEKFDYYRQLLNKLEELWVPGGVKVLSLIDGWIFSKFESVVQIQAKAQDIAHLIGPVGTVISRYCNVSSGCMEYTKPCLRAGLVIDPATIPNLDWAEDFSRAIEVSNARVGFESLPLDKVGPSAVHYVSKDLISLSDDVFDAVDHILKTFDGQVIVSLSYDNDAGPLARELLEHYSDRIRGFVLDTNPNVVDIGVEENDWTIQWNPGEVSPVGVSPVLLDLVIETINQCQDHYKTYPEIWIGGSYPSEYRAFVTETFRKVTGFYVDCADILANLIRFDSHIVWPYIAAGVNWKNNSRLFSDEFHKA